MAIYTSNYARKGQDVNAFGISVGLPDWFKGQQIIQLAPTWDMVMRSKRDEITHDEYTEMYLDKLESQTVDIETMLDWFPDPAYLLCYEKPGEFCHRRIFAKWVEERSGWVIPEWLNPKEAEEHRQANTVDDLFEF